MSPEQVFVRKSSGLLRQVSPFAAFAIAFAAPNILFISNTLVWGTVLYPGANFFLGSWAVIAVYPTVIIYMLLAIAMPRSGGEYLYTSRSLGPGWGLFTSWQVTFNAVVWVGVNMAAIPLFGIPALLMQLSLATHNPSLWALGTSIANPTNPAYVWLFVVGLLFTTASVIIHYLGTRYMAKIAIIGVVGIWATMFVWVLMFIQTSPSAFVSAMEAGLGINFQKQVVDVANASPGFLSGTFLVPTMFCALVYVVQQSTMSTSPANFAGEIKSVQKAQIIAQIGSIAMIGIFYTLGSWVIYHAVGLENFQALSQLDATGADIQLFGTIPTIQFLSIFASPNNMTLPIIGTLLWMFALFCGCSLLPLAASRNLFAYSIDGLLPTKFSTVDDRGSPWIIVLICAVFSYVSVYLFLYTPYLNYLSYANVLWFAGWTVLCIAAIAFPYMKSSRGIYEQAPSMVRAKLLGVPVLVIMGVLGVVMNLFIAYVSVEPALTGSVLALYPLMTTCGIGLAIPIVIYALARAYARWKAIDIAQRFRMIPPD